MNLILKKKHVQVEKCDTVKHISYIFRPSQARFGSGPGWTQLNTPGGERRAACGEGQDTPEVLWYLKQIVKCFEVTSTGCNVHHLI